jgi:hypothetical protein
VGVVGVVPHAVQGCSPDHQAVLLQTVQSLQAGKGCSAAVQSVSDQPGPLLQVGKFSKGWHRVAVGQPWPLVRVVQSVQLCSVQLHCSDCEDFCGHRLRVKVDTRCQCRIANLRLLRLTGVTVTLAQWLAAQQQGV